MVDLSIVIVSWNARDYLLGVLESIAASQGDFSHEVIVVDNNSDDGSPEAVEEHFPQTRLIRTGANLGFAKGNNRGIEAAQGRYVFLVNSDVEMPPDALARLVAFMDANPDWAMVGPRVLNGDGTLQHSCRYVPTWWRAFCRATALDSAFPRVPAMAGNFMYHWDHREQRRVEAISGCFMCVRREAIEKVGMLDAGYFMYAEDVDWCKRFNLAGYSIGFYPAVEITHFGGGSSGREPVRFAVEKERASLQYWRKHHGFIGMLYYAALVQLQIIIRLVGMIPLYLVSPSRRETLGLKIRRNLTGMKWLWSLPFAKRAISNPLEGSNG